MAYETDYEMQHGLRSEWRVLEDIYEGGDSMVVGWKKDGKFIPRPAEDIRAEYADWAVFGISTHDVDMNCTAVVKGGCTKDDVDAAKLRRIAKETARHERLMRLLQPVE